LAILGRHAHGARAIARCDGAGLIEEKHPVLHIAAMGDGVQCRTAIQQTVAFAASMTSQCARFGA